MRLGPAKPDNLLPESGRKGEVNSSLRKRMKMAKLVAVYERVRWSGRVFI
jgi:hypothetical protein